METRASLPVPQPHPSPLPSYWHTPLSPLANLIEPAVDNPSQNQIYDYTIIGSGITGTMLAYYLLCHSSTRSTPPPKVLMLEARTICSGATGRNGGHTKAASYRTYLSHVQELGKEEALKIARLEYANILATHELARTLGIAEECESVLCETVDVVYDAETFDAGKKAIETLRADMTDDERQGNGPGAYAVLSKSDVLNAGLFVGATNTNPAVRQTSRGGEGEEQGEEQGEESEEEVAGAFTYLAGRIHAYRFTTALLQACLKHGLTIATHTPAISLTAPSSTDPTTWHIRTAHNNTTTTTIPTHRILLATNAYTASLLPTLHRALVPLRGQITAQTPGRAAKIPVPLGRTYSFVYRGGYEYMVARVPAPGAPQHFVVGGGLGRERERERERERDDGDGDGAANEYGSVDDGALNPRISTYLRGCARGYFGAANWGETGPEEARGRVVHEWTGIMGATADGRPFVGEVPGQKGLWVCAGFNGHGMVLCLKSAEALVQMVRGGAEGARPEWFPESFLISEERLSKCEFRGRTDL
ncbi:hypothetical protein ACN47E_009602 [Coniothyrium glycines]